MRDANPACSGGSVLGGEQRQDHVLDPEPGIDRLQLRRQQAGEMAGVAARPGGADADMLDPAVDPVKGEVEPARPHSLARQPRRQVLRQPLDGADEIGRVGDRLGEAEAHPPHRRLAQRRQRLRQVAERLVEAMRAPLRRNGGRARRAASGRARRPAAARPGAARPRSPDRAARPRPASGASAALLAFAAPARPAGRLRPRSGPGPRRRPACRRPRCGRRCSRRRRRRARSAASAASPPHKWPQPVISILMPSVPSRRGPRAIAAAPFGQPGQRRQRRPPARPARSRARAGRTARRPAACPAQARPPPPPG